MRRNKTKLLLLGGQQTAAAIAATGAVVNTTGRESHGSMHHLHVQMALLVQTCGSLLDLLRSSSRICGGGITVQELHGHADVLSSWNHERCVRRVIVLTGKDFKHRTNLVSPNDQVLFFAISMARDNRHRLKGTLQWLLFSCGMFRKRLVDPILNLNHIRYIHRLWLFCKKFLPQVLHSSHEFQLEPRVILNQVRQVVFQIAHVEDGWISLNLVGSGLHQPTVACKTANAGWILPGWVLAWCAQTAFGSQD